MAENFVSVMAVAQLFVIARGRDDVSYIIPTLMLYNKLGNRYNRPYPTNATPMLPLKGWFCTLWHYVLLPEHASTIT